MGIKSIIAFGVLVAGVAAIASKLVQRQEGNIHRVVSRGCGKHTFDCENCNDYMTCKCHGEYDCKYCPLDPIDNAIDKATNMYNAAKDRLERLVAEIDGAEDDDDDDWGGCDCDCDGCYCRYEPDDGDDWDDGEDDENDDGLEEDVPDEEPSADDSGDNRANLKNCMKRCDVCPATFCELRDVRADDPDLDCDLADFFGDTDDVEGLDDADIESDLEEFLGEAEDFEALDEAEAMRNLTDFLGNPDKSSVADKGPTKA